MADTRVPFLIHLFGFWGVAIPVSRHLAFERGLGAPGLWWGLVCGLVAVALVQLWRLSSRLARGVTRVQVEDAG
jgi:MATE family multidrug resistance protein